MAWPRSGKMTRRQKSSLTEQNTQQRAEESACQGDKNTKTKTVTNHGRTAQEELGLKAGVIWRATVFAAKSRSISRQDSFISYVYFRPKHAQETTSRLLVFHQSKHTSIKRVNHVTAKILDTVKNPDCN